ncbi:MAG: glycoside hydrolase family 18 protein, partial [Okeania sp. SIO2D1]|nr:glycoside hydrolase family 18 protein [Okeania sp. SIO2D1]
KANENTHCEYEFKSKSEEEGDIGFNPNILPRASKKIYFNAVRDVQGEPLEISNVFFNDQPVDKGDNGAHLLPNDQNLIGVYYPEWSYFPVENIPAEKVTHIFYAFAKICPYPKDLYWNSPCSDGVEIGDVDVFMNTALHKFEDLRELKERNPDLVNVLSIGGWSLSRPFSNAAATPKSRERFITSAVDLMKTNGFDGLDIDWEFPVANGLPECQMPSDINNDGCNIYRPEDKENYTLLLQGLRTALDEQGNLDGKHYVLSIAGPAGYSEMENLELDRIYQYLDFINLMTYDYHGSWDDITNHQAALHHNPSNPYQNDDIEATVVGYLAAGVPADKINLGVPMYDRGWTGVEPGPDNDGLFQSANGSTNIYGYKNLYDGVDDHGNPIDIADEPGQYNWDDSAGVPYLYNPDSQIFSTYEDVNSIQKKVDYIKDNGLNGMFFWEITTDLPIDHPDSLLNKAYEGLSEEEGSVNQDCSCS